VSTSLSPSRFLNAAFAGVSLFALSLAIAAAQDLKNGTFEDGYQPVVVQPDSKAKIEGEIAQGWKDESSWAEVDVAYSVVAKGRNGSSAQKVDVKALKKGGVQLAQQVTPEQGKRYTITAWAKADKPGEVIVQLRKATAPYTTYAYTKAKVGTDWTEIKATGVAMEGGDTFVLINPVGTGTYLFDDVTLEDVTVASSAAEKPQSKAEGAGLTNGGFEGSFEVLTKDPNAKGKIEGAIAPGWMDESAWGEVAVVYAMDEKEKHGGKSAQRIEVKSITNGGVQFIQKLPLTQGHTYRATAWVRSEGSGQADFLLRKSGAPYTFYGTTRVQLSPEWTEVVVAAKVTEEDVALVMFNPAEPGTYWIDDVTLTDVTNAGN
jgi:hypothetical protein